MSRNSGGSTAPVGEVVEYSNPRTAAFRATLDRLPDEIALAIGSRLFDLGEPMQCVCGWAVREAIAREVAVTADDVSESMVYGPDFNGSGVKEQCVQRFGGTDDDWDDIFGGVCDHRAAPLIEEALFDRVMAAATASPAKRSSQALRCQGADT